MAASEKHTIAPRWRATIAALRLRDAMTYPKPAHPSTFGTAKTTNPGQPKRWIMSQGRYIPMHHVQLQAQKNPQPIVWIALDTR